MATVETNDVEALSQTSQLKDTEGSKNQHHIIQTDEIITVVVSKTEKSPSNSNKSADLHSTSARDNQSNEANKIYHSHANGNVASPKINDVLAMNVEHRAGNEENEDDGKIYPKSILTNCDNDKVKSLMRKKSVSFGNDEDVTKFISGEEIVDKKNPFRQSNDEDYTEKFKITKVKKSVIPTKVPRKITSAPKANIDETDFISKEEILKQSKYVPVYIRNPDKVLTYDRSVLERLALKDGSPKQKNIVKRAPVPVPRKSINELSNKRPKEKKRTKYRWENSKYPDLADIKVKTGPSEVEESLYDHNEVVLNVKKFDSLYKKLQFGSTDDIDEISEKSFDKESSDKLSKKEGEEAPEEEKKSYTNTVNSSEFREYLKKKGLVLFPVKANGTNSASSGGKPEIQKKPLNEDKRKLSFIEEKPVEMEQGDKTKKTVFRRLSSIFSKSKTTPKANGTAPRLSFTEKDEDNRNSAGKRVVLERSNIPTSGNQAILANNEFFTSHNFLRNKQAEKFSRENDDEDKKSSISSVLTAAADDDNVFETPVAIRKAKPEASQYRNIDLNRSKLYQTVNKKPSTHPPSFDNLSQQLGDDVIKPRVYRPSLLNRSQPVAKSQIKPPVPLRRSSERQSLPLTRIDRQNVQARSRLINGQSVGETSEKIHEFKVKSSSTPNEKEKPSTSPDVSPISSKNSELDPFTFAKIHEIKKRTDAVLLNKSINRENPQSKLNNQNFVRNSEQRSTISEMYRKPYATSSKLNEENYRQQATPQQPPRSQSVLDSMTCFNNSLYGEVTYRHANGDNVNVIMRRPESSTLDKRQVMQKIYEYYRKSVNNTPVSFIENNNLQVKSQSTDTSPSYASVNTATRSTFPKVIKHNGFYVPPNSTDGQVPQKSFNSMPRNENLQATRKPIISDSGQDSIRYLTPNELAAYRKISAKVDNDNNRIYDVVYGSAALGNGNQNSLKYQKTPLQMPRPTSAMDRPEAIYARNLRQMSLSSGRTTPLVLQPTSAPRHLPNQMDIIYNNQIYRPISALQQRPVSTQRVRNEPDQNGGYNYQSPLMRNRSLVTPDSEGSEIGEVGRIMQNRYIKEEDYQNDKSNRNQQNEQVVDDRGRRSSGRRDDRERDIRRHTLGSDMLHYTNQGGNLQRSMDLEMSQPQKSRKVKEAPKLSYIIHEDMYARV